MLRAFGAFLLLFWLLSLVVHLHGTVVYLFGISALVLFAIDLLAPFLTTSARGRMRGEPLI
jgi:hypothetical protein